MRRHLTAARTGIVRRAHCSEQHLLRRGAQSQAKRAVAIVRKEPVVPRLHSEGGGGGDSFVSRAGDLEEYFLLPLEHDLAIVEPTRGVHHAIDVDELLPR